MYRFFCSGCMKWHEDIPWPDGYCDCCHCAIEKDLETC